MTSPKLESKTDTKSVQTALANKDFLAYLAKAPDQQLIDPAKPETVQREWQIFQLSKTTFSNLKEIYNSKIKGELGTELSDENLKKMGDYLDQKALTSPEELAQLAQKLRAFNELPERIEMRRKFIYGLGSEKKLKEMEALLAEVDEQNKKKSLVQKMASALDKISLKNFEWTELKAAPEDAGKFRKFAQYLGNGAIVFYDDMRLAAMSAASLGKTVLGQDIHVKVQKRDQPNNPPEPETPNEQTNDRAIDYAGAGAIESLIGGLKKVGKETLKKMPSVEISRGSKKILENEEALENKFNINPSSAGESLKIVREKLAQIKESKKGRKEMEEELDTLRDEIFDQSFLPAALAAEVVRQKITENFNRLVVESKKDEENISKLLEVKDQVSKVISAQTDGTFDYVGKLDIAVVDKWANRTLEKRARTALGKAIDQISIETEDNPLAKLEQEVSPFLTGDQTTRDFFIKGLRDLIDQKKLDNSKITLLKMLLTKIEMQKIEADLAEPSTSSWAQKTKEHINKAFA